MEVGPLEVGVAEVGLGTAAAAEVCALEIGPFEVGAGEGGFGEVGLLEVGVGQEHLVEAGAGEPGAREGVAGVFPEGEGGEGGGAANELQEAVGVEVGGVVGVAAGPEGALGQAVAGAEEPEEVEAGGGVDLQEAQGAAEAAEGLVGGLGDAFVEPAAPAVEAVEAVELVAESGEVNASGFAMLFALELFEEELDDVGGEDAVAEEGVEMLGDRFLAVQVIAGSIGGLDLVCELLELDGNGLATDVVAKGGAGEDQEVVVFADGAVG